MKTIWYLIYNIFVIPSLYLMLRFAGLFNEKIRKGISGRERVYEELILNASSLNKNKKLIWFHSSSLGEFEQAKPIIEKLKKAKDVNVLITFFSPSGYENSKKYPYADLIAYLPFDTIFNTKRFISITNPSLVVIMKYDIWPNIINALNKNNIPVYLVDATMLRTSARKLPLIKTFHKIIFEMFDKILTVSNSDAEEFKDFGLSADKIKAVGDTRFDRVYQRSLFAKDKKLINANVLNGKKVFVTGSTWEQDEEVIIPAFLKLNRYDENVLLIIAPHEPIILHLEKIENEFSGKLNTIRFSYLNNYNGEQVIIVDSIGILLTLYAYADLAFVGGSYKQNVHNVLEAAVYGIPVLFGPKIGNSQEAKELAKLGGGIIIENKRDAFRSLRKLFTDDDLCKKTGKISFDYVKKNIGSTEKILTEIYKII